jgi:hypothetical protein
MTDLVRTCVWPPDTLLLSWPRRCLCDEQDPDRQFYLPFLLPITVVGCPKPLRRVFKGIHYHRQDCLFVGYSLIVRRREGKKGPGASECRGCGNERTRPGHTAVHAESLSPPARRSMVLSAQSF